MARGKACEDTIESARRARGKKEVNKGRMQNTKGKSYEEKRKRSGTRRDLVRRQRCREEVVRGKDAGQALGGRRKYKQVGIPSGGRTRAGCICVVAVTLVVWYMQVAEKARWSSACDTWEHGGYRSLLGGGCCKSPGRAEVRDAGREHAR